jgi:formylglycine-generating enzyme required for sulfatase activity
MARAATWVSEWPEISPGAEFGCVGLSAVTRTAAGEAAKQVSEYRLPTEAEWEYACRAGSDEHFSVPARMVWSRETSERRPHEVGESPPNKWGLSDMHGNAMEWCFDAWCEFPRGTTDVTVDPFKVGNPEKDTFVVRGGAWWSSPHMCSSHWRAKNHSNANGFRGFRIVLGPEIRDLGIEN